MKILVTGSAGFVGSNLLPLLKQNHEVQEWDLKQGKDIFGKDIEDCLKDVDVVIHLAALTSVTASFDEPEEFYRTNVLGTARILELCLKHKVKLIYPSSAAVYHRELSPYAESKALAEDLVQKFIGSPAVILRFFNIYGEGMNAESGSIMYRFMNDDPITIFGDGEQTRDYINVYDLIHVIEASIGPEWDGEVVDVGTGEYYSANYIAGLFAHHRGVKVEYLPPKREIKWSVANPAKLLALYGDRLTTKLDKDIEDLLQ